MAKKFLLGIVAAAAMVGCIKRTEVEPTDATLGSATISGQINMSTDLSNDTVNSAGQTPGTYDQVFENDQLNGIQVRVEYDRGDLDPNYAGTAQMVSAFGTVSATGTFSVSIPTPAQGMIDCDVYIPETISVQESDSLTAAVGSVYATYPMTYEADVSDWELTVSDGENHKIADNFYEE